MRSMTWFAAVLALGAALVAAPPDSLAQTSPAAQPAASPQPAPAAQPAASAAFSAAQLEQLVAPIALYPDALLTQTLMASTYPLEIVEAARWYKQNASLKGTALEEALKATDWDPSVKSICSFPEVLKKMDENLDWMQDLGDAFLAQQKELLETVQRMRAKAYESGNLKTTEQQVVKTEEKVIIIEPANPQVVYVPTYSPTVVYAGWSYPSYYYPSYYAPVPPGYGLVSFTAGMVVGAALWGNCNWGHSSVHVDVDRYNNYNRNTNVNASRTGTANWEHSAEHRRGVNYQNSATAQKYGGTGGSNQVTRDQARGRVESRPQGGASAGTRPAGGGAGGGSRPSAGTLPAGGGAGGDRPAGGGAGGGSRPSAGTLPAGGGAGGDRPAGGGAGGAARPSAGAGASAGTRDVPRQVSGSSGGSAQRPTSSVGSSSSGGSRNSAYSGSRSPSSSASSSSRGASSRGTSSYSGSASSGGSRPSGGGGGGRGGGGGGRR